MFGKERIGTHLYEKTLLTVGGKRLQPDRPGPFPRYPALVALAERRPTAYARWRTNRTDVRRRLRRRYLSMDRLYSISRELLFGPFGHIFFFVRLHL